MSRNYDNWERLVAAVLKKQEIWELCHAHSRSTSFSSILSDFDPSSVDENLKTIEPEYEVIVDNQIVDEWVEEYESGVSITFLGFRDRTRCLKRIYFSRRRFSTLKKTLVWWSKNYEKVYEKHIYRAGRAQVRQLFISSEENNPPNDTPNKTLAALGRNKGAINSETNLVEICESANRKRPFRPDSRPETERVERLESGVHITLLDLIDGTRDIIRVRLSAIKFKLHEAETWWDKNRLTIYKRYNVWPRAAQVEQSTVSMSEGENAQRKP